MVRPKRSSSVKTFQEEESDGSGEESEWEQTIEGQGVAESDDAGDGNEEDAEEESKPDNIKSSEVNAKVKKAPWNKGLGEKRKRPSEYDTDNEDGEDGLPTIVRKTDKGGYAHTKKSRARIGKANKGKSPWNKGKHRSEEVKAKIRAGVVARNQAILAVKLKKLGMTEGEWITKKKEIKYLRERVRRAKLAVNKKKEEMTQAYLLKLERELKDVLELRSSIDNNVSIVEYVSVLTCRVKISLLTLSLS
jgi:NUMOD3 motif